MASIVRKENEKSVTFQVRYRVKGKQKAKNFTSKGTNVTAVRNAEREAKRFLKEIEAKTDLGLIKDESEMLFEDYADYVFKLRDKDAGEWTKYTRRMYLKVINKHIGKLKLKDITAEKIEMFFLEMSKEKSERTLLEYKHVINIVLETAVKKKKIEYNPMYKVDYELKRSKKSNVQPIDEVNFKIVLNYSKENRKYYYLLLLLYQTGMRVGEALAITWDDFDYDNKVFYINKARKQWDNKVGSTKTKESRQGILHTALLESLEEIKMWQQSNKKKFGTVYEENNLVICSEDGSPITYTAVRSYLRRAEKATGVYLRPHQLRHTFVSMLIIREGLSPKVVQKLVGHKDIQTTLDVYAQFFNNKFEQETFEQIEHAFSNSNVSM